MIIMIHGKLSKSSRRMSWWQENTRPMRFQDRRWVLLNSSPVVWGRFSYLFFFVLLSLNDSSQVDMMVTDTKGQHFVNREKTDKGKFAFTTDNYDVFEICFISRVPANMRGGRWSNYDNAASSWCLFQTRDLPGNQTWCGGEELRGPWWCCQAETTWGQLLPVTRVIKCSQ